MLDILKKYQNQKITDDELAEYFNKIFKKSYNLTNN